MDHRLIDIAGYTILLDRFENDDEGFAWQVIISIFLDRETRYDDWVSFQDPERARAFIKDFSQETAAGFVARAQEAIAKKQPSFK